MCVYVFQLLYMGKFYIWVKICEVGTNFDFSIVKLCCSQKWVSNKSKFLTKFLFVLFPSIVTITQKFWILTIGIIFW